MTTRADYSDEAWQVIVYSPCAVGMAVLAGRPHAARRPRRLLASVAGAALQTPHSDARNELLAEVVVELRRALPEPAPPLHDADALRAAAVAHCGALAAILRRAPRHEAEGFKRWLLAIAEHVARGDARPGRAPAANVTPAQQATLAELRDALELAG